MKTNNAALATFIDEKYIPLAPKIKLGITVWHYSSSAGNFLFFLLSAKSEKIQNLSQQKVTLAQQITGSKIKSSQPG